MKIKPQCSMQAAEWMAGAVPDKVYGYVCLCEFMPTNTSNMQCEPGRADLKIHLIPRIHYTLLLSTLTLRLLQQLGKL